MIIQVLNDDSKRKNFPGGLSIVATPIGNLEDFSPRGREALEKADTVLCEDTRQGAKLIAALGVSKPLSRLERLDEHVSEKSLQNWIRRLKGGESFALITDAGTPAISDPGSALVALAHEAGVRVTPVPGPSAVPTLLSVAGFQETSFTFRGFFPRKNSDRARELERAAQSEVSRVFVWFESPQRMLEALESISAYPADLRVIVSKELTKIHERYFHGNAGEVLAQVRDEIAREGARGEWCFAIRFAHEKAGAEHDSANAEKEISREAVLALRCLIEAGISPSDAAKRVSQYFGGQKKRVYDAALRMSGKKNDLGG